MCGKLSETPKQFLSLVTHPQNNNIDSIINKINHIRKPMHKASANTWNNSHVCRRRNSYCADTCIKLINELIYDLKRPVSISDYYILQIFYCFWRNSYASAIDTAS